MRFLDSLLIRIFCKYVDQDNFGNKYYTSYFKKDYLGREKRFVLYKGINEPSKVPPKWHAWLHHLEDSSLDDKKHSWQKDHQPNLTGTKLAYNIKTQRPKVSADYNAWFPWRGK